MAFGTSTISDFGGAVHVRNAKTRAVGVAEQKLSQTALQVLFSAEMICAFHTALEYVKEVSTLFVVKPSLFTYSLAASQTF